MKPIPEDTGSFLALAMSQAERKDCAAPFVAAGKPIWLVGLSFARETRKFLAGAAERWQG